MNFDTITHSRVIAERATHFGDNSNEEILWMRARDSVFANRDSWRGTVCNVHPSLRSDPRSVLPCGSLLRFRQLG